MATVMGHEDIAVAFRYYRKWIKTMADRLVVTLDTTEKPRRHQMKEISLNPTPTRADTRPQKNGRRYRQFSYAYVVRVSGWGTVSDTFPEDKQTLGESVTIGTLQAALAAVVVSLMDRQKSIHVNVHQLEEDDDEALTRHLLNKATG